MSVIYQKERNQNGKTIFFDCYGGDMGRLGGGHAEKGRGIFFKVCRIVVGRPLNFILEKKYNNKDKY